MKIPDGMMVSLLLLSYGAGRAARTGSPPSGAAEYSAALFIPSHANAHPRRSLLSIPIGHKVSDDIRIPERIVPGADPGLLFELAGPM